CAGVVLVAGRAGHPADADRLAVGFQVDDAGRALAEVLLEDLLLLRRQLAVEVAHQELDDFLAGHAPSPRKWASSRLRRARRARWRRVLTTPSDTPSSRAASPVSNSSMSRSSKTVR